MTYSVPLNADPNGGTLDYISSIGGKTGLFLKGGVDIGFFDNESGYGAALTLFSGYENFGELSTVTNGYATKLKVSGFSFGGGLKLFF